MNQQYLETVKLQNAAVAKALRELQTRLDLELNTLAGTVEQTGELMHAEKWDIETLIEYRAQAGGIIQALNQAKIVIAAELDKVEPIELSSEALQRGKNLLEKLLIAHHVDAVGVSQKAAENLARMDINNSTVRDIVYNLRSWGFVWSEDENCWTRLNFVR